MHFLLLLIYGLLNRIRGSARLPKIVCYMLFGVLACVTAYMDGLAGGAVFWGTLWLLAFAGSFYGFDHCWGKYFPNLNPVYNNTCVPLVDNITTKLYVPYNAETPDPQVLNWKTIGMSWRWMIFFSPKYVLLTGFHYYNGASAQDMMFAFLICIGLLAMVGILYRIGYIIATNVPQLHNYAVAIAEVLTGILVIGVADWVALS